MAGIVEFEERGAPFWRLAAGASIGGDERRAHFAVGQQRLAAPTSSVRLRTVTASSSRAGAR